MGPRRDTLSRGEPTFLSCPDQPAAGLGPELRPSAFEAASLPRLHSRGISSTTDCGFCPGQSGPSRGLTTGHTPQGRQPQQRGTQGGCCPQAHAWLLRFQIQLLASLQVPCVSGTRVSWVTGTTHLSLTLLLCKLWKAGAPPRPQSPHLLISCCHGNSSSVFCFSGLGVVKNGWG